MQKYGPLELFEGEKCQFPKNFIPIQYGDIETIFCNYLKKVKMIRNFNKKLLGYFVLNKILYLVSVLKTMFLELFKHWFKQV